VERRRSTTSSSQAIDPGTAGDPGGQSCRIVIRDCSGGPVPGPLRHRHRPASRAASRFRTLCASLIHTQPPRSVVSSISYDIDHVSYIHHIIYIMVHISPLSRTSVVKIVSDQVISLPPPHNQSTNQRTPPRVVPRFCRSFSPCDQQRVRSATLNQVCKLK
jgi:hypothetical protein